MASAKQTSSSTPQTSIVNGIAFNPDSTVLYTKPKINNNGGKSIGILNSDTKKGLYLSTPLMLTWGLNKWEDEATGKKSFDISLQFPTTEYQTQETTEFLKNLSKLEKKLKADAISNSKEWLNKNKVSEEVVDALWSPMLKYPKDKDSGDFDYSRSPSLRVKIPYWDGVFNTEVFDINQKTLFPNDDSVDLGDLITKGSNIATVIQSGGLWFANGKFGTTWKLFQCVVKPKETLRGKCHISLSSDDKEKLLASQVDNDEDDDAEVTKTLTLVDDSDEENVEEEEEEEEEVVAAPAPAPAPAPAASKKRVVRKKGATN